MIRPLVFLPEAQEELLEAMRRYEARRAGVLITDIDDRQSVLDISTHTLNPVQVTDLHPVLIEKLNAALEQAPAPVFTCRDLALPVLPGKVHAVIGMRRAGKSTFLAQLLAEQRGREPPERSIYLSFDDDRLDDLGADQLSALLEAYYRRFPELRGRERVHWFLDEVQVVSGWDRFARRVIDSERLDLVVSGSSARLLSREVHTALRGRSLETIVRPFSFREFLRHRGEEPDREATLWTRSQRSLLEKRLLEYLVEGGFPEAQGLGPELRIELLQGYVASVVFRDVVERHGITQVAALRWLVRHCLRNPAGMVSAHRLHLDLKGQGLGVGKDFVHAALGHLTDVFLLSLVPLATESERRRNSNPRKVYPVDPGLAWAYSSGGRAGVGHALETVVEIALERQKAEVGYVRTATGFEVDFHARYLAGAEELLQVCADPGAPGALERELRALAEARQEFPQAARSLVVLTHEQASATRAPGVNVQPAAAWLLNADRG